MSRRNSFQYLENGSGSPQHQFNGHQGNERSVPIMRPISDRGVPMPAMLGRPLHAGAALMPQQGGMHGFVNPLGPSSLDSGIIPPPMDSILPLGAMQSSNHRPVTKLREHWDETNSKVMQRKSQLDAMLGDSQLFEAKRFEVEAWMTRMETRLERMNPVGHTADVLEVQLREQKSFHAELHQYKHHIELFNSLTQRLIAVYQQDDTSQVKKLTETINQRYNNLNTSIISRGKYLHSAMNSLHNFDRSLDKFLAWLSEAESSTETLETEADRICGGRRDQAAISRSHLQYKFER
ncbi:hypothetical protein TKK_0006938 [Trichogramma kaykai]